MSCFSCLSALAAARASKGSSSDSASEKTEMRTYKSPKGNVNIPARPKRIVTDFYAGELLSVGANVVGSGSWSFDNPFLKSKLKNVKDVGDPISVEKVMELQPDLIVVMNEENVDKLKKIAPTVVIPYNTAKNVEDTVSMFGDIAGAKDKAKSFMADFNKKRKRLRRKLPASSTKMQPSAFMKTQTRANSGCSMTMADAAAKLYTMHLG